MHLLSGIAALAALLACLLASVLYFLGILEALTFKTAFLLASIAWFAFAWLWAREKQPGTT